MNYKKLEDIGLHEFYFETPLYSQLSTNFDILKNYLSGSVVGYNPYSKIETTFKIDYSEMGTFEHVSSAIGAIKKSNLPGNYEVKLTCKRTENEYILIILHYNSKDNLIEKIGQFPSSADIQYAEIGKKYDKLLLEYSTEFKRAIGLAAHGVGAGSLVYLRRIFEKLIFDTFKENISEIQETYEEFEKLRMNEKVELIVKWLPEQLKKLQPIYGILSKGIHELPEKDCKLYFPVLKTSIELILDQKLDQIAKLEKENTVEKAIKAIQKNIIIAK